jgi:hypothetical protein
MLKTRFILASHYNSKILSATNFLTEVSKMPKGPRFFASNKRMPEEKIMKNVSVRFFKLADDFVTESNEKYIFYFTTTSD